VRYQLALYPRTARWSPDEFSRRMQDIPHRIELVDGRVDLSREQLEALLALAVELLGTAQAVQVGPRDAWRQAVSLL
jgi:hypothetical protein